MALFNLSHFLRGTISNHSHTEVRAPTCEFWKHANIQSIAKAFHVLSEGDRVRLGFYSHSTMLAVWPCAHPPASLSLISMLENEGRQCFPWSVVVKIKGEVKHSQWPAWEALTRGGSCGGSDVVSYHVTLAFINSTQTFLSKMLP